MIHRTTRVSGDLAWSMLFTPSRNSQVNRNVDGGAESSLNKIQDERREEGGSDKIRVANTIGGSISAGRNRYETAAEIKSKVKRWGMTSKLKFRRFNFIQLNMIHASTTGTTVYCLFMKEFILKFSSILFLCRDGFRRGSARRPSRLSSVPEIPPTIHSGSGPARAEGQLGDDSMASAPLHWPRHQRDRTAGQQVGTNQPTSQPPDQPTYQSARQPAD